MGEKSKFKTLKLRRTTCKKQILQYILKINAEMFYLGANEISSNMKLFFYDSFFTPACLRVKVKLNFGSVGLCSYLGVI